MYTLYTKRSARYTRRFSNALMHNTTADTIFSAMYAVTRAGKNRIIVAIDVK